jgi:hypothetical protein
VVQDIPEILQYRLTGLNDIKEKSPKIENLRIDKFFIVNPFLNI